MAAVYAVAGALLVALALAEAFEALVLPRRVIRPFPVTRAYYRVVWRAWAAVTDRLPGGRLRSSLLAIFGPFSLLMLFALWAALLVLGFGLVHHALVLRSDDLADSLYFSGVTFTTLGYGDLTPRGPAGRVLSVLEAGTGFGFFAVVIGYLPVLYQSFSRREAFIVLLDARAGSPPAAGRMLLRTPPRDGGRALFERFLADSETWAAQLLESHLSFPVLGFYRSQHDNQSWLAALVATLDTAALLLTVVEGPDRSQARLTFAMARHALVELEHVLFPAQWDPKLGIHVT